MVKNLNQIRGTYFLSKAGVETEPIRDLILRRRLQILVHSCLYYVYNETLISDYQWATWAQELVQLQKDYPYIAARVDYAQGFKGFDASTGFDLPIRNPEIMNKAQYLLKICKEKKYGQTRHQVDRTNSRDSTIRLFFPQ